jgi:predicted DNA-binding protein with PD1-like motif
VNATLVSRGREQTYVLVFDTGDEVISELEAFARERRIEGAHFTAIGAFSDAALAYFDWRTKEYRRIPVSRQVEVLVLAGDIAWHKDEPVVHAHVVVGTRKGRAFGGHLLEAHVRPTLEVVLTVTPRPLRRTYDRESGLPLIDLGAGAKRSREKAPSRRAARRGR